MNDFLKVVTEELTIARNNPGWNTLCLEKLMQEREYFIDAIRQLAGNSIEISDAYIDEVYTERNLNRGMLTGANKQRKSVAEIFSNWQDYQKFLFVGYARQFGVVDIFQPLGYDFSFMGK